MSEDQQYYLRWRGRITGPYELAELRRLKSHGELSKLHDVSTDQMTWSRCGSMPELWPHGGSTPPAASAPSSAGAIAERSGDAETRQVAERYYLSQGHGVSGPYPSQIIVDMIQRALITPEDLVSAETTPDEWVTVDGCELFGRFFLERPPANANMGRPEVRYAGFWRRLVAYAVDTVILLLFLFTFNFILALCFVPTQFVWQPELWIPILWLSQLAFDLVIVWFYAAFMESSARQATLGKMATGIVVTDLAGNRISFWRATGRFFGKAISTMIAFFGYLMIAFTAKRQALHDIMAGTLVVRE